MRLRLGGDRVEGDYTFELADTSTTGPDCFWRTARLRVKEGEVVVLMELDFEGVSREDVEALSNDVGARENPPAGLIAHVVTDTASGVHAVDIWESAADFQRFNQEQLMPSTKKIAEERGLQLPDPPPVPRITEAYDLVRGS
jgi:hypothetical protein